MHDRYFVLVQNTSYNQENRLHMVPLRASTSDVTQVTIPVAIQGTRLKGIQFDSHQQVLYAAYGRYLAKINIDTGGATVFAQVLRNIQI